MIFRHGKSCAWPGVLLALLVAGLTFVSTTFAASPQRVRFTTFNVNFNNSNAKVKSDVQAVAATTDIIAMQEAKSVTIDNFLGNAWTVIQVVDEGDAKRGSAIAIRNSVMTRLHGSGLVLGSSAGSGIMRRFIAWADVEFTNGQIVRVLALHYPPRRADNLWPEMTGNLVDFVNNSPYPVIAGADWNFTVNNDPQHIERDTGLTMRGVRIDGFAYNQTIMEFVSITEQTGLNVNSDHDPVRMNVDVQPIDSVVPDWMMY